MIPRFVASSCNGHAYDNPRIVVTEDARILLVALRIRRNLTHFHVVGGVGRVVKHNTVIAIHHSLNRVDSLVAKSFLKTYSRHGTPALALDEYLAFLVLVRSNLVAVEIVGAEEPFAVPSVFLHSFFHSFHSGCHLLCLLLEALYAVFLGVLALLCQLAAERDIFLACNHEETCNHERLCLRTLAVVFRCLETLVGVPGEAVEV